MPDSLKNGERPGASRVQSICVVKIHIRDLSEVTYIPVRIHVYINNSFMNFLSSHRQWSFTAPGTYFDSCMNLEMHTEVYLASTIFLCPHRGKLIENTHPDPCMN